MVMILPKRIKFILHLSLISHIHLIPSYIILIFLSFLSYSYVYPTDIRPPFPNKLMTHVIKFDFYIYNDSCIYDNDSTINQKP